jgi:hypothetical protein
MESSPSSNKKPEPEQGTTVATGKPRAVYRCKQCGLPAKGHDCAFRLNQHGFSSNIETKPKVNPKAKPKTAKPHQQLLVRRKQQQPPHAESKERKRKRRRQQEEQQQQQQQQQQERTGRQMERGNDRDDDQSSFSLSSNEPDERKVHSRHRAAQQHQKQETNRSHKRQRQTTQDTTSTEVLMALHIFQDQVHAHGQEHGLFRTGTNNDNNNGGNFCDVADERFLTVWSELANRQFHHQNQAVAHNLELVAARRLLGKRVQKERHALTANRSKMRRVQAECAVVEQELADIRQQKSTRRAASRFLNALERCQT